MTEKIRKLRSFFIEEKGHHAYRQQPEDPYLLAKKFRDNNVTPLDRSVHRIIHVLKNEQPIVFKDERITFTRTVTILPELFTPEELNSLKQKHWIHEQGEVCNINVDYTLLMNKGFNKTRITLKQYAEQRKTAGEHEKADYLLKQESILAAVQDLADRYAEKAREVGNTTIAETLSHVPANAPNNFLEALQMFRILHYTMWCGHNYHNTIGRFDQYMYPYFIKDMKDKVYTEESALELLEEFFLTFNRDSDLYTGMQQGDNGQSMVLGGLSIEGKDQYNLLSELCLKASLELNLIDPKINLRVNSKTPLSTYVLGTELTKKGLGFPQYSNDDVVVPGLIDIGYDKRDAYNYVVAACWEFIVPGCAMDIPNIEAVSFAKAVSDATVEHLPQCKDYGAFQEIVKHNIYAQVDAIEKKVRNLYLFPAPFISLMVDGCMKYATDVSLGAKYNNYGIHGTGIATAVDSLEAIERYVYIDKSISANQMVEAVCSNFKGYEDIRTKLRYHTPKMGNNEDSVDQRAVWLLDVFADALKGRVNERGGCFRAGTGSAMYYIWHAENIPATPDGREKGEALGANYSPGLYTRAKGPVSIMHSFAKPNLRRVINGGPLTIELHDTVFRNQEAIKKVATLVKSYMDMGGHQLQLNAVNRDTLVEAQKHPEKYQNLIVRVWGWSAYFVELDKVYQDHIMQRMELQA